MEAGTSNTEVTLFVNDNCIRSALVTDVTGSVSNIPVNAGPTKRMRKRKLFFDEDSEILDVKTVLKGHDNAMRLTYGDQIIRASGSLQPLTPPLRRHLIKVVCTELIIKCHSNQPSTDQREQLAECIVSQLYPTLAGKDRSDLKNSYYFPSTVVTDSNTGKKKSLSPTG
ncbi:unnamed protein product, partial [Allacma fusca]